MPSRRQQIRGKREMMRKLYMITTRDKYELPLIVEDSPAKLARRIGMNPATLRSSLAKGYKGYCRVEVDDEEADL